MKNTKISDALYKEFQDTCGRYNLETVLQALEFYNNRDVEPFLKACLKNRELYYELQIDMYKDAFTLSGLASIVMNRSSFPKDVFDIKLPPKIHKKLAVNIDMIKIREYQRTDLLRFGRYAE